MDAKEISAMVNQILAEREKGKLTGKWVGEEIERKFDSEAEYSNTGNGSFFLTFPIEDGMQLQLDVQFFRGLPEISLRSYFEDVRKDELIFVRRENFWLVGE